MICVTGQLLRCLWAPWKDHAHWGQGWPRLGGCSLLSGGSRASHMTEDWEGSAGGRPQAEGRAVPQYGCCVALWLVGWLAGWLAGWLPGCRLPSPNQACREWEWEWECKCEGRSAICRPTSWLHCSSPPQERMSAMSQLQPSDSSAAGPGVDQIQVTCGAINIDCCTPSRKPATGRRTR